MTDLVQAEKTTLPSAVANRDVATYYIKAAVAVEQLLQEALLSREDASEFYRELRNVQIFASLRSKVGELIEKARAHSESDDEWDPFAVAAKSEFTETKKRTKKEKP